MDLSTTTRVLIIKPSSLGDVVHTLPAVSLLHQVHPHWQIDWLINPEWAPILQGNPHLRHIRHFPRAQFRGPLTAPRFAAWLRVFGKQRDYDLVLDFQGLLRSALAARATGAKRLAGLSDAREGSTLLYHHKTRVEPREHAVRRYLKLAVDFGVGTDVLSDLGDGLPWDLPAGEPPDQELLPNLPQKFLMLHPFSRGEGKSLELETIQGFAAFCQERGLPLILVGKTGRNPAQLSLPPNTLNLLNRTSLLQLIWLMRRAALVVSVDSGPMHLAAALSPRVAGIHAWTDPVKVGPYRPDATVIKAGQAFTMEEIQRQKPDLGTAPLQLSTADLRKLLLMDLMAVQSG
jgi:heptosyltransferase-1